MSLEQEARTLVERHLWTSTQRWVLSEGCSSSDHRREEAAMGRLKQISITLGEGRVKAIWAEVRAGIRSKMAEAATPFLPPEVIAGWLAGRSEDNADDRDSLEAQVKNALRAAWHAKNAAGAAVEDATDWSDSAVSFSKDFLKNGGGGVFEVSANVRTLARTIQILRGHVTSAGSAADPVKRRTLRRLLRAVEELNLLDACRLLLTVAGREGGETPKPG